MTDNALTPVDAELAALQSEMRDLHSSYYVGPQAKAKQERCRNLLDARDSGAVAPIKDKRTTEIEAIKAKMADLNSEYYHGPRIDGETVMQRQYRQILDGGTDAVADGDWRATPAAIRQSLPPAFVAELVEEWGPGPEFDKNIRRVQDVAAIVVGALGEGTAAVDFMTAFDGLAAKTKARIFQEIALPESSAIRPASTLEMAKFRKQDGGEATIKLWGDDAPRRVGMVLDKVIRVENSLSKADKAELKYWWDHQTSRERQLMLFAMGSA